MNNHNAHNSATQSEFCILRNVSEVSEGGQPLILIYLEMVSNGPLLSNAFFDVIVQNGSAKGLSLRWSYLYSG